MLAGPREVLDLLAIEQEVLPYPVVNYGPDVIADILGVMQHLAIAVRLLNSQQKLRLLLQSLAILPDD